MALDNSPVERVEFGSDDSTACNSLSDALSWIREQSSAKRNHYKSKWTEDIHGHCGPDSEEDGDIVERHYSLHARATAATDASIYSRGSELSFDCTPSPATGRLSLLQGSSYDEPDISVDADAVGRLRAKLERLSKDRCPESLAMHSPIGSATAARCRASSAPSSRASPVTQSLLLHTSSRPTSRASDVLGSYVQSRHSKAADTDTKRNTLPSAVDYSPDNKRPLPTVCVFDPERMQGSQRSAKKAAKRAKDEVAAEAKARRKSLFKARQAALSSRPGTAQSVASFVSPPPSLSGNRCNGMSDSSSRSSQNQRTPVNRVPKRNTARRRKLVAEIDSRIHNEMNGAIVPFDPDLADDNDDMSIASDGSDMPTLLQEVGRLGAQLKQRQAACERTLDEIEALDNLDNIDYIDLSDVPKHRSKTLSTPLAMAISPPKSPEYSAASPRKNGACTTRPAVQAHRDSLYRRQEKWVSALEKKLDDARLEKADEIMSNITGKPRLVSTGDSWQKAKAAHDAAARRAREDYERKMKAEDSREAIISEQKLQVTRQGEREAAKTKQEINKQTIVDKKRQIEYAERLARPRRIVATSPSMSSVQKQQGNETGKGYDGMEFGTWEGLSCTSTSSLPLHNPSGGSAGSPEASDSSSAPGQQSHNTKSFADMDDKEFANVMRRLGIKSVPRAKGVAAKKKNGPASSSKRSRWHRGDPMNKMPLDSYYGTPTKSHSDKGSSSGARANPSTKSKPKGRYLSSDAQASLLKKMTKLMDAKSGTTGSKPLKITAAVKPPIDKNRDGAAVGITPYTDDTTTCPPVCSANKDGKPSPVVPVAASIDQTFMEPYERYEAGQTPFFDVSSSDERGRFRVRDASSFIPDSMRRMVGSHSDTDDGIMFLVGRKNGVGEGECAITILFDRKKFSEDDAIDW
eukprot:CAMPEP_0178666686 /NCGR_PEP_ID=MMETSP0698-20121128/30624_1 /TAXON_ID=265572 /ORGANISM="Extubocellulus spinifer, Strain CCMP396" /LENGTH=916 /DNA_ID=CAMNT_0020310093 /DNA_START=501 /DNA_END=3248 /DNA_ORIENTATION=+